MIKKLKSIGFLLLISLVMLVPSVAFAADGDDITADELKTIKNNYRDYYRLNVSSKLAMNYVNSQLEDGSWADINYNGEDQKIQTAWVHINRLHIIASSANTVGHELNTEDKAVAREALKKGFKAWQEKVPLPMTDGILWNTKRWWNETIGQQLHYIAPTITQCYDWVSEETLDIALSYLLSDEDMKNYPGFLTGANLIWYLHQGMIRAVFTDDCSGMQKYCGKIKKEVTVPEHFKAEGIQADNSFHQHGSQYYTTYSSNFVLNTLIHSTMLKGTALEDRSIYKTIADMLLDGDRWLYHGAQESLFVTGRNKSNKYTKPVPENSAIVTNLNLLANLYPERSEEILAFRDYILADNKTIAPVTGHKHFWCSDITAHKRDDFSVMLHMVSDRTISTESNYTQNRFGAYIGFGTLFISVGDDYLEPYRLFFDWGHLPGNTNPETVEEIMISGTFITQKEDFAGGVSDGIYGASAMKVNKWASYANKGYFFFDDCYVALGSGITTAQDDLVTTIDQRAKFTDILVNGEKISDSGIKKNVSTIYENNIGYFFPEPETLTIKHGVVEKSYSEIAVGGDTTVLSQDMMMIWKSHDKSKRNDTYAYVIYPKNSDFESFNSKVNSGNITIVSNTKNIQAVYNSSEKVGYAVFYETGSVNLCGVNVSVTKPCIMMIKETDGGYDLSVAEPACKYKSLSVTISNNTNSVTTNFDLPQTLRLNQELGGKTVTKSISF